MTKMLTVVLAAFVVGAACAATISLSDARAKISECIRKPAKVSELIKQLAAGPNASAEEKAEAVANQVAFLSAINAAITAMPGSAEAKAAAYLNVNHAAVSAASDTIAMLAEVFATVPVEVLPIINERFAEDLLNINADPSRKYTEEQFTEKALEIMKKVNERCATAENCEVRATFAILMLVRASNNSFPGLIEKLVKTLPEGVQNTARNEWIPAALATDQTKTYEPLLGYADNAGKMPANGVVARLAGPQLLEALLPKVVEGTPIINNSLRPEIHAVGPREYDIEPQPQADPSKEPWGYQGQLIW